MDEYEIKILKKDLYDFLTPLGSSRKVNIDDYPSNNLVIISIFWDRISSEQYDNVKTFRIKTEDVKDTIETEIKPFFSSKFK